MTDKRTHNWLWLDLETTCLDPHSPGALVLEVAAVFAADDRTGDLSPVHEFTTAVRWEPHELEAAWSALPKRDAGYVRNMHTVNGLLTDVANAPARLPDVEEYLGLWVREICGTGQVRGLRLAGNSVGGFDLQWIRIHMPKFAAMTSHQVLDVTSLKAFVQAFHPDKVKYVDQKAHRALADVRESLATAAWVRQVCGI